MADVLSQDVVFKIDVSATPTAIGGVVSYSLDRGTTETVDVTDFDSNSKESEFIAGISRGGTLTLTYNFDPTDGGQAELDAVYASRTIDTFTVECADSGTETYTFSGLVTNISDSGDLTSPEQQVATIQITGGITIS